MPELSISNVRAALAELRTAANSPQEPSRILVHPRHQPLATTVLFAPQGFWRWRKRMERRAERRKLPKRDWLWRQEKQRA